MRQDPSLLEAALLGLLARNGASGYALRKVFQTTPLAAYSDSPGAIYPALRRLKERKLVAESAAVGGRRRTTFRLTAAGRAWLRRWIARPVTPADVARDQRGTDLRLALVSHIAPARLPAFLRQYAAATEAHHGSVQRAALALQEDLPLSSRLALELGLHLLRARYTWCRQAARAVTS